MRMNVDDGPAFDVRPALRYHRLPDSPPWSSDLHLDLLLPQSQRDSARPAVLYFHGGGWSSGGREQAMYPWLNPLLASAGMVTASVTYRLSGDAPFPAQLDDARTAVQWIQDNSAELGVDPSRIGAWGDSAGGHLALLLGTAGLGPGSSSRPDLSAVVARCAPSDFTDWFPPGEDDPASPIRQLFGGAHAETRVLRTTASPLSCLPTIRRDLPAFQLVHGDQDETVPFTQSEGFVEAVHRAGGQAELHRVRGGHHNMSTDEFAPWSDRPWTELGDLALRFFRQHL